MLYNKGTMSKIEKLYDLEKEYDIRDMIVVRVHTSKIATDTDITGNLDKFKRNSYVKITNQDEKKYIIRLVRGESSENFTSKSCRLDYDSRGELKIKTERDSSGSYEVNLEINKASLFNMAYLYWNYPNQPIKIAYRLSILSVILGIISFLN